MSRSGLAVTATVLALLAAGCGGADEPVDAGGAATDPAPAETTGAPDTPAPAETATTPGDDAAPSVRLAIVGVDPGNGTVTLRNLGDEDVSLSGLWVCNRPSYTELPAETIAAGGELEVDVRAIGIAPTGGEVALYRGNSFSSADAILDYVTWGGGDAGRRSVAVEAGIWPDGGSVANDGAAFAATVDDPQGPDDYAPSS